MDTETRFWNKVDKSGECWIWTAGRHNEGYGNFNLWDKDVKRRQIVYAHRFVYEMMVGLIPPGLTIDHLCRNRACVNPAHLEVVTQGENVLRGSGPTALNAKKTHCSEGHPFDLFNTRYSKTGKRACLTCEANRKRRRFPCPTA